MTAPLFSITTTTWEEHLDQLMAVRRVVFVEEQKVPEELDADEMDVVSVHALAVESVHGRPIGTARLLPNAHIGRVAVLKEWRKRGVGLALMNCLLHRAREEKFTEIVIDAQTHTVGFYQKLGFVCEGAAFEVAGIPHRSMRLSLI